MTAPAVPEKPRPRTPSEVARRIRTPKTPSAKTTVCTTAILLISSAGANMVYGMQGGAMDLARALWTLAGLVAGGGIIYVFSCHSMLDTVGDNKGD